MKSTFNEPYIILPEEAAPLDVQQCERCELSKQRNRVVWGEGDPNAPIMLIMDNPGARENQQGDPFLCGTRETLQAGLREVGLKVDSIYVTYLLKCRPIRAYDKPVARQACSSHLQLQLEQKKPLLLFGFGNVVAESLLPGSEDASVKTLRGSWMEFQGIPIGFTYHPLAIRRRPNLKRFFMNDLMVLAKKWEEISMDT